MPMPPPLVSPPRAARILNRREAAGYLGISQKSVILLEAQGALVRVALIAGPSKGRRRALYDIADLDRLVEQRKQRHRQAAPMSRPRRRRPEAPPRRRRADCLPRLGRHPGSARPRLAGRA
jgi:hypothetical protein